MRTDGMNKMEQALFLKHYRAGTPASKIKKALKNIKPECIDRYIAYYDNEEENVANSKAAVKQREAEAAAEAATKAEQDAQAKIDEAAEKKVAAAAQKKAAPKKTAAKKSTSDLI